MSAPIIQRIKTPELAPRFFRALDQRFADIRRRAFELFEQRGSQHGSDCDDWMRAERDLFYMPEAEVAESDRDFRLKAAIPYLEHRTLVVTVLRRAIVIQGKVGRAPAGQGARGLPLQSASRDLFRYFDLPATIDIENVEAHVQTGVLEIVAPKAGVCARKQMAAAA